MVNSGFLDRLIYKPPIICEECGGRVFIGDHPFCPHGKSHGAFLLKGPGWTGKTNDKKERPNEP